MRSVTDDFLSEVNKPSWTPIRRAYMLDSTDTEVEITNKVANFDRILWQIEQQYTPNVFTADNCRVTLKNENEEFDVDKANNFFVATLNRNQDGYKTPVQIKAGYILPNGTEEIIDLFYGLIVDIDTSTRDDRAIISLQGISKILRDADADNIGDQWTDQQLYGGQTYTYLDGYHDDSLTDIVVYNTPSGNFPDGFPPYGIIKIDDEIIYYSDIDATSFLNCIRGYMDTVAVEHSDGSIVEYLLPDGSSTEDLKFHALISPLCKGSIESIETSDGDVDIWEHRHFLKIPENRKKRIAWVDIDNGIFEFADTPSDSSSIIATYKSCYRNISYHTLVKRLLEAESFGADLVQTVQLTDPQNESIPTTIGAITHVYSGGSPIILPDIGMSIRALCIDSDDNLWIGMDYYLIRWNGEQFDLIADLGTNKDIYRLAGDDDGNIYGVCHGTLTSDRDIFKWNGSSISYLTTDICRTQRYDGFSVDTTNDIVWFLYRDSPPTEYGVAKVSFDGADLTKYSRSGITESGRMDFVDIGDSIEFFYYDPPDTGLTYESLDKSSGTWTNYGVFNAGTGSPGTFFPYDLTYHPNEDRVYMNVTRYYTDQYHNFGYIEIGTTNWTTIRQIIDTDGEDIYRLCGGVYYDGYVWYIEGTYESYSEDCEPTGHLWKFQDGVGTEIGAMLYRPDTRDEVAGLGSRMVVRSSDETIFLISTDAIIQNDPEAADRIVGYSPYLFASVKIANMNGRKIWDVLEELARLSNYELGTSGDGDIFFRRRQSSYTTLVGNINSTATTISVTDTTDFSDDGMIQVEREIIYYSSKTSTSFTNCTRGYEGSTAVSHDSGQEIWEIHQVIANFPPHAAYAYYRAHNLKLARKFPNWDDIRNYVKVPYGDYTTIFDYEKAEEIWTNSSEYLYGRKILTINNEFLTDEDAFLAEAIAWRYYDYYNRRASRLEVETTWQPQLEVGDTVSIKQVLRTVLDYVVLRLKRIEVAMSDFFVRMVGQTIAIERETIYD